MKQITHHKYLPYHRGGTVNICDELFVSNGTVTITGGTVNIGTYSGSSNGSDEDRFEMDNGTLTLSGGTINVYGQYAYCP